MSDLISRLSLKDRVSEYALSSDEYERFRKIIDAEPTAYDIDKVVEELEERQKEYLAGFGVHNNDEMYGVACGLGDAIEIVKQGGISDDVCEWKQDKGCVGLGAYNISCCDKTLEMPVSTAR